MNHGARVNFGNGREAREVWSLSESNFAGKIYMFLVLGLDSLDKSPIR